MNSLIMSGSKRSLHKEMDKTIQPCTGVEEISSPVSKERKSHNGGKEGNSFTTAMSHLTAVVQECQRPT